MPKQISKRINKKTKKPIEKKKVSPPRRYLWKVIILLLLVVVGVIIFLWNFLQRPVSSVAHVVKKAESVEAPTEFERFEGNYLSFARNSKYALKSHLEKPENGGVILESAFFSQGDVNSKKIALTVENIEGRTMADTGNFIMRQKDSKKYAEEKFEISNIKGIYFSKTDNGFMERVYFIPRGNYVAEIAFTGPMVDDDTFNVEMLNAIKSIQWKK